MNVKDVMTSDVVTVRPETSLKDVAAILTERRISGLPVVDEEGRLVGIVTRADLVRAFVRPDAELEREIREKVLERALLLETPETVTVVVDEDTLIVKGPGGTKHDKVGATLTLKAKGLYRITMVKQAPDDNHLKLTIK